MKGLCITGNETVTRWRNIKCGRSNGKSRPLVSFGQMFWFFDIHINRRPKYCFLALYTFSIVCVSRSKDNPCTRLWSACIHPWCPSIGYMADLDSTVCWASASGALNPGSILSGVTPKTAERGSSIFLTWCSVLRGKVWLVGPCRYNSTGVGAYLPLVSHFGDAALVGKFQLLPSFLLINMYATRKGLCGAPNCRPSRLSYVTTLKNIVSL